MIQSRTQQSPFEESDLLVESVRSSADFHGSEEGQSGSVEEESSIMESFQMTKLNWINIFLLGGGFFLLFTAFQTTAFVQVGKYPK